MYDSPGRKLLKTSGVLLIIFGGIGLVSGFMLRSVLSDLPRHLVVGGDSPSLNTIAGIMIIASVAYLVLGIMAIAYQERTEKANILLGGAIVLAVYDAIMFLIILPPVLERARMSQSGFDVFLFIIGLGIYAMCIVGASKVKNAATTSYSCCKNCKLRIPEHHDRTTGLCSDCYAPAPLKETAIVNRFCNACGLNLFDSISAFCPGCGIKVGE